MRLVHVPKLALYLDVSHAGPRGILEPMSTQTHAEPVEEDHGIVLTPEEEEELERASEEAEEDMRMGRCITFDEMRAELRSPLQR